MFENPRRGRQARNVTTNAPKILDLKSPSEQIFSRKLPLCAPDKSYLDLHQSSHHIRPHLIQSNLSVRTSGSITDSFQCSDKILIYIFFKKSSLIRTTDTRSHLGPRWICTGWIPSSLAGELSMQGDIKPSRCIPNNDLRRFTEEHKRLFEGFNNYR